MTASPAWVGFGATVTVTATLRVADVDAYERLANNPLAGRIVTLQRRVTGTTAWVGAGTMSAGPTSGTYVASARLVTGSEFRAVFATPAGEGLRGARLGRVPGRRRRLRRLHLPARRAGRRPGRLKGIGP